MTDRKESAAAQVVKLNGGAPETEVPSSTLGVPAPAADPSATPRPYKLIGCVQHDCEACIIREQQYKERCEEAAELRRQLAEAQEESRICGIIFWTAIRKHVPQEQWKDVDKTLFDDAKGRAPALQKIQAEHERCEQAEADARELWVECDPILIDLIEVADEKLAYVLSAYGENFRNKAKELRFLMAKATAIIEKHRAKYGSK